MAGAVVVLAVAAGASSCAGRADRAPGATVPDASTTSTTAADDWAIPATIDAAYVERVLAELDRIDGDAARIIVAEGELVPSAVDRLRAIYGTDELNLRLEALGELIARDFAGMKRPPGDRRSLVESVQQVAGRECVIVDARRDLSAVATNPPPQPRLSRIRLEPANPAFDPSGHNRTGWSFTGDQLVEVGTPTLRCP